MALNELVARITVYSVSFLITQDGAGGNTITLNNQDFLVNLTASGIGGPLVALLSTDFAPNNQAIQRARLLGDATGLGAGNADMRNVPHCKVEITARTGADGWIVDADVDGIVAARGELNITGPAGASTALLTLQFRHTYDR